MADQSRLEDLRRRVQRDPASIAFAQLAEEYRRDGQYAEAVETCRAGLALHPGYLSARVTLGRALIELNELADAQAELELVLRSAPENLAAIRGLADIFHKRGDLAGALAQYQMALALARNDPELEDVVNDLTRQLARTRGPDPQDGLSLDQVRSVFARNLPQLLPKATPIVAAPAIPLPAPPVASAVAPPVESTVDPPIDPPVALPVEPPVEPHLEPRVEPPSIPAAIVIQLPDRARGLAVRQIGALEEWLTAVHVARAERHA